MGEPVAKTTTILMNLAFSFSLLIVPCGISSTQTPESQSWHFFTVSAKNESGQNCTLNTGEKCTVSCGEHYQTTGEFFMKCVGGSWNSFPGEPICQRTANQTRSKRAPNLFARIRQPPSHNTIGPGPCGTDISKILENVVSVANSSCSFRQHNYDCPMRCQKGYKMADSVTWEKNNSYSWNNISPICVETNGTESSKSDNNSTSSEMKSDNTHSQLSIAVDKCSKLKTCLKVNEDRCIFYNTQEANWRDSRNYVCRRVINSAFTKLYTGIATDEIKEELEKLGEQYRGTFWTGKEKCSANGICSFGTVTLGNGISLGEELGNKNFGALCEVSSTRIFPPGPPTDYINPTQKTTTTDATQEPETTTTDATQGPMTTTTDATQEPMTTTTDATQEPMTTTTDATKETDPTSKREIQTDITTTEAERSTIKKSTVSTATDLPKTEAMTPTICKRRTDSTGVLWEDTNVGEKAMKNCPEGHHGIMEWFCGEQGEFIPEDDPKRNCRQNWLEELRNQSKSDESDPVAIVDDLDEQINENGLIYGDDITATLEIIEITWQKMQNYSSSKRIFNYTKSVVSSFSEVTGLQSHKAWQSMDSKERISSASKVLRKTESIVAAFSCVADSDHYGENTLEDRNTAVQTHDLEKGAISFPDPPFQHIRSAKMYIPPMLKERQSATCGKLKGAGYVYTQNFGHLLTASDLRNIESRTRVNSDLIGFQIATDSGSTRLLNGQKINIVFKHSMAIKTSDEISECVFWKHVKNSGEWSKDGCEVTESNETHTWCRCNHLTVFAVLCSPFQPITVTEPLKIITMVFSIMSITCLAVTILCLQGFRSLHCQRSTVTCNLSACLIIVYILVLVGLDKSGFRILCAVIKSFLHYWLLASFIWMLLEGILLYQMTIVVFTDTVRIRPNWFYAIGYGIPAIIVGITIAVRQEDYFNELNSKFCYLSRESGGEIWSFLGPMAIIVVVNFIFVVMALQAAANVKVKKKSAKIHQVTRMLKGSFFLFCLLGVTWSIGILHIERKTEPIVYIFTVLNNLQGFFIFLFHVVLNQKTRTTVLEFLKGLKIFNKSADTTSNRIGGKMERQSTRTTSQGTDRSTKRISIISNSFLNTPIPRASLKNAP